jgi:tRNA 2-selenouridine synthase
MLRTVRLFRFPSNGRRRPYIKHVNASLSTGSIRTFSTSSNSPRTDGDQTASSTKGEKQALPSFVASLKPYSVSDAIDLGKNGKAKLIDVRSPTEFAEDCIPNSENLPVLDDDERKTVGTLHKLSNKVEARQVGAALIAKRIASHLAGNSLFAPDDAERLHIIYCARGGLRSQSLAMILSLIGHNAHIIDGGYKSYRQFVQTTLEQVPPNLSFNVLCGLTGTKKTVTLAKLRNEYNQQVLDLEDLANHRGSVLGGMFKGQPSQKLFESRIVAELRSFDVDKPVWIESESQKVGNLFVPSILWEKAIMEPANVYELVCTVEERVEFLCEQYKSWHWTPDQLKSTLKSLEGVSGPTLVRHWQGLVDQSDFKTLIQSLLLDHYDLRYKKSKVTKALASKAIKTENVFKYL